MTVRKLEEPQGLVVRIPLTTEAPLAQSAPELTDVYSARQYMQKSVNDKFQDEDIETLIFQATEEIQRYCNREFTSTNGATRSFEWTPENCFDVLDLAPYEIRTLTKAVIDPETESGKELTNLQSRLRPYPARDGTFFALRLSGLPQPAEVNSPNAIGAPYRYFTRRIDLTGNWGMSAVPDAVRHWANITVKAWAELHHDVGLQGAEFGEGASLRAEDLPIAARFGLKRWMRPEALV